MTFFKCIFAQEELFSCDLCQKGQDKQGILTLDDLANYTAVVRESLNSTYHGEWVWTFLVGVSYRNLTLVLTVIPWSYTFEVEGGWKILAVMESQSKYYTSGHFVMPLNKKGGAYFYL